MSCPDCFQGHIHAGNETGQVTKLHGLDCYISEPPQGTELKGVILFITDVFGWELPNSRFLCDRYAAGGYRVYMPDFANGSSIPGSMMPVFKTLYSNKTSLFQKIPSFFSVLYHSLPFFLWNRHSVLTPKVISFAKMLRQNEAAGLPLGAAGFCWGGKVVFQLCVDTPESRLDGEPLLDAGFTGHPSMIQVPTDAQAVRRPLSIANGDLDVLLSKEKVIELKRELEDTRSDEPSPDGRIKGQVVLYPGVGHGFAVRGDLTVEDIKDNAEKAEKQALNWFDKWLSKS